VDPPVEPASEGAFEAASDLAVGLALDGAFGVVGVGFGMTAQAGDRHGVQGVVEVAVTATVETVWEATGNASWEISNSPRLLVRRVLRILSATSVSSALVGSSVTVNAGGEVRLRQVIGLSLRRQRKRARGVCMCIACHDARLIRIIGFNGQQKKASTLFRQMQI
jgi:hypothetical protein